jgi:hypothetical protein
MTERAAHLVDEVLPPVQLSALCQGKSLSCAKARA